MQLTNIQKQTIISKIKDSQTFKKAPTSIALLQYLFDATIKGTHLKEGVVDIEFFGTKEPNDKNNPRVRVNVYNLRKKIDSYYEADGKEDSWKLIIDKGQYQVRFFKNQKSGIFNRKIKWTKVLPYIALIIAVVIIFYTNTTSKPQKIWKTFLSKNVVTNLFIGDHFGVTGKTATGGMGWTRDFNINSINEFYDLVDEKPELKKTLKPSNYSYSTRMAALTTQHFQRFYQTYNKTFNIRFSTQSSISEIKESNAIYAGPTKNGNKFIHFFNEGNPYFKISNSTLILANHPGLEPLEINIQNNDVNKEFAIVSKYPSINNTEHFVFFSQHDIGVSATVEYFTNTDSIIKFSKTYLKSKPYFTALFEVKGQDRTNTSLKLKTVVTF